MRKKEAKAASTAASSITAKEGDEEEKLVEDPSLPKAQKIKIRQSTKKRGVRVVVKGWVSTVRVQSRKLAFVDLRDGSDQELQCILTGKLVFLSNEYSNNNRLKVAQSKNSLLKLPLQFMVSLLLYSPFTLQLISGYGRQNSSWRSRIGSRLFFNHFFGSVRT